jgi:isochorismate hydrolase
MRESYISSESFIRKAGELIRQMRELRGRDRAALTLEHSALLVIDMQEYFLDPASHACVPSARDALTAIRSLIAGFSRHGRPIVFTRHLNTAENAGMLGKWWADLITRENPLSEISPELDVSPGTVVEKTQYDAFHGTSLEETLRERGVTRLVICGLVTHLCCETTARSAFVRGFEVVFAADGTASYGEAFHLASLLNLSHGFATPMFVQDILAALEGNDDH